jgi:thiol-disulfide isomerase/thioredoxin
MKSKKSLIFIILGFVLLFAVAFGLYSLLGENVENNILKDNTYAKDTETKGENDEEVDNESKQKSEDNQSQSQTVEAPDFTVYDAEGNEVRLSDFKGKPIILNFWASWCGPCKSEMPDFDEAYGKYKEDINFLMINLTDGSRETVESASEYINSEGYSFDVYFDTETEAAIKYSVFSIPTTYFIDADGMLVTYSQGAINAEALQQGIDMIL